MPDRNAQLKVVISGDTKGLDRATRSASNSLGKLGKDTTLHARVTGRGFSAIGVAARGAGAAAIAGAAGVGFLVKQFEDSNKIAKQTNAVLKSTGGEANVTAKQVSNLATAISRKTGIDDEAVQSSENMLLTFTNVRNEVGKGNNIFTRATRTVQDMSVALGQDGKSSAIQLGKALNDPIKGITALRRVGVSFTESQQKQIKALVDSGHAMDAQKLILRELNKEFGGSAAAQATPFDKLKVSAGNLAETLGGYLAPTLGKAASWLTRLLNQMQDGTGTGGRLVASMKDVAASALSVGRRIAGVVGWLQRHRTAATALMATIAALVAAFATMTIITKVAAALKAARVAVLAFNLALDANPVGVVVVGLAALAAALVIAYKRSQTFRNIVDGAFSALKTVVRVAVGGIVAAVNLIKRAFSDNYDKIRETINNAIAFLRGGPSRFLAAAKNIGGAIVKGIINGLAGLPAALADKVKSAVSSIPGAISGAAKSVGKALISPFGDGVGQAWASSQLPVGVTGGAFSGSLMGARPVMGTFAREGARFGLGVSSGRRAGSITSSGNLSWHSTGEAIDLSNGYATPQELAYAKYEAAHHGGQLAELIHTPLGFGIKDGRRVPLSFWGPTINAQHMNHVHVAYDSGKPGIGDGIGQIENLWMQAGGPRSKAAVAGAVAEAESSGNPGASNRNSDGSIDRGLWQINSVHGALSTFDRMGNARAAVRISSGGSNWRPWTTYVSGAYRRFLGPAQAALAGVKGKGGGGAPVSKPKGTAFGKVTGTLTPAGSYGAQIVGVSDNGGPIKSTSPGLTGKYSDVVDAQEALATLTSSTADDLRVANIRVHDARVALRKAKKTHNAKKIAKAAGALRSALDTRNSLKSSADTGGDDGGGVDNSALIDAINANTEAQQAAQAAAEAAAELERQRIDLETQMVANQNKLILLQNTQGPQLLSAVIAAVNGGIGGKIGLGYQSVGFAGQVART